MARSKKSEPPAAPQGDAPAAPANPPDPPPAKPCPEPRREGPAGPAPTLYGFAHLRAVMNLTAAVPIDQVCEEAALELTRLHAEQRPRRWTDSDRV